MIEKKLVTKKDLYKIAYDAIDQTIKNVEELKDTIFFELGAGMIDVGEAEEKFDKGLKFVPRFMKKKLQDRKI